MSQPSNFARVSEFFRTCGKGQTVANASTQIGCHLEECVEFLDTLSFDTGDRNDWVNRAASNIIADLQWLATKIKSGEVAAFVHQRDRKACLDALCDMDFTGNGVAYLLDMQKEPADTKVIDSCFDKLVDGEPVILPGGKIGKREGWVAPDLSEFV
jgi:hypothetical protein